MVLKREKDEMEPSLQEIKEQNKSSLSFIITYFLK